MTEEQGPYVCGTNSPLNRVYLPNGEDTEKTGKYGAQIGLVALMLPLSTEVATEEKTNTCVDRRRPVLPLKPANCSRKLGLTLKEHRNQSRWREGDRKISNGKGSLGH